ncbi:MAG: Gfo/Idh/MocA family protein, partial [Geminicoccaceae bacterium]
TTTTFPDRKVTSTGPMTGKTIDVELPTTMHGVLSFENGAMVTISTSWDVWKHDRRPIEIYGATGSMLVPDPNFFGGMPKVSIGREDWTSLDIDAFAFGKLNRIINDDSEVADYRIVGLLDMAAALRADRPHRADGAMALHVLEVMDGLGRSSTEQRHIEIESRVERPMPLPKGTDEQVFL